MNVPEFLPSLLICGSARFFLFVGIDIPRNAKFQAGDRLVLDLLTARVRKLCNAKRSQILLPPNQASQIGDDILLKRADRRKFSNESAMQFFERSSIFSGQKRCGGIARVFESGMNFLKTNGHRTPPRFLENNNILPHAPTSGQTICMTPR